MLGTENVDRLLQRNAGLREGCGIGRAAGMWRRRRKRCGELPRQLALGLLEDALGRVDDAQRQAEEAQRQAEEARRQAEEAGKGQPAEVAAGAEPAAVSVPAPRASGPSARHGWLFFRAQEKTTQRGTSDPADATREDSGPRRL